MQPTTLLNPEKQINFAVCFVFPTFFVPTGVKQWVQTLDILTKPSQTQACNQLLYRIQKTDQYCSLFCYPRIFCSDRCQVVGTNLGHSNKTISNSSTQPVTLQKPKTDQYFSLFCFPSHFCYDRCQVVDTNPLHSNKAF